MREVDNKLKDALHDWQIKQLQNLGVTTGDNMFGPQLIMMDKVLEHILDVTFLWT